MVPYRGRHAIRVTRLLIALICAAWFLYVADTLSTWVTAVIMAYPIFAIGMLLGEGYEKPRRSATAIVADASYFTVWATLAPDGWPPIFIGAFLLASSAISLDLLRSSLTALVVIFVGAVLPSESGQQRLLMILIAMAGISLAMALYRNYIEQRMSLLQRHNVVIRAQSQNAGEAERQRIAADFHDGPLQSFVAFQMRLELIKRLIAKDTNMAVNELTELQELCKGQVTDLRSFVRSMRPRDEGMSLAVSLNKMVEAFQRDTGIASTYTGGEIQDPGEIQLSLEVLQIVREAFNNIQKHSGATRVAVNVQRREANIEITLEDNGGGFPFAGTFNLDELEMLHMGPASIKRRVRVLEGDLELESRPSDGAKLTIRIPVYNTAAMAEV